MTDLQNNKINSEGKSFYRVLGHCSPGDVWDFNSLNSPLLGVSENLTNFRKTEETSMDPHLMKVLFTEDC